jgi:ABC-type sugar transport system substrate-binding protein
MSITPGRRTPRHRRVTLGLTAGVTAIALVAVGCGSSGGGSSGSSSNGSSSSGVSAAKQTLGKYTPRPTSITQTTPIKKQIPTGKKITFISCGVEACAIQGPILKQGAKTLGWSVTEVGTDGSPEKLQNAIEAAVRNGTNAIILNAADPSGLGKAISDAKAKGVEFVTCCSLAKQGSDVLFNTGTPEQNAPIGNILASKVVADSGGKADTVYVNVSAFAILAAVGTEFEKKYKQYCPDCKFGKIDVPLTSLGKDAPDRIVSYLRSHPSVNYVVLSENGSLGAGLPGALQAAGLGSKVKIIGQGGNQQTYQDVKSGKIVGVTPASLYGYDYSMLDALARKWSGQQVLQTPPEFWFMSSSDVPPAATAGPAFPIVQDYQAQWAKLWGKSPSS